MNQMRPLKANPIQELRRILRDQYDFNSILKELIQNADDAGATQFHIGWMDNWPQEAYHPLLCSPAIVVLNDGEFTSTNAKAICCIDVGSKGADLGSIGKFGLGMKSVFHLCEAFFFLTSSNQPAAKEDGFKGELLNPWSEMSLHDDWGDNLEQTCSFLNKRIENWDHGCDRWFCLVIPLRTEQQLNGNSAIIEEKNWDINQIIREIPPKVGPMMPLLRFLDSVTIWTWSKEKFIRKSTRKIKLKALKCRFPGAITPGSSEKTIRGQILFSSDDTTSKAKPKVGMIYAGKERLLSDSVFTDLKNDEQWPRGGTLDNNTGVYKDKPEEAEPHCAVVFSVSSTGNRKKLGSLQIRKAYFLPLAHEHSKSVCHGDLDFQLLLHGYFFLDAGRKDVYLRGMENKGIENQWNEQLMDKGIYPLVLPALEQFIDTLKLSSKQVIDLVDTISRTDFFKQYRDKLCYKKQWFYCTSRNEEDKKCWRLLKSEESILRMPAPPDDSVNLPFEVFPDLSRLCKNANITYESFPYLSSKAPIRWQEQQDLLKDMLGSIENKTFINGQRISYLVRFLEQERPLSATAAKQLIRIIKRAVQIIGLKKIQNFVDKFKGIISLIDDEYWVSFPVAGLGDHPYKIFNKSYTLNINRLILPKNFSPDNKPGGKLSIKDSVEILKHLSRIDIPSSVKSVFALRIVQKTNGDLAQKKEAIGKYPLFLCRGYINENERLFCWNDLETLMHNRQVFAGGSSFAAPLQMALRNMQFYRLIESSDLKPFQILFGKDKPPSCDKKTCFEILGQIPQLNEPEKRKGILNQLQGIPQNFFKEDYIKAMRYILHGSRANFNNIQTVLLREPQIEDASLLNKMAHSAMRKLGEEWRWLIKNLSDTLSPERANELKIQHIDFNAVEELLKDTLNKEGIEWLSDIDLSRNERNALLIKIQDITLWRQLPLHETVNEQYVSITRGSVYYAMEENFSIPSSMESLLTVVRKVEDANLDQKYRRSFLKPWNPEAVLKLICEQKKPDKFYMEILEALIEIQDQNKTLQSEISKKLKETRWLLTSVDPIAPKDIIFLPQIENEIANLLFDPDLEGKFYSIKHVKEVVKGHEGFFFVEKKLLPTKEESLEALSHCLNDFEKYHIGYLKPLLETPQDVKYILKAFDNEHQDLLPICGMLRALRNDVEDLPDGFLRNLIKPIDIERIIRCLEYLTKKHIEAANRDKNDILKVFNWYLESLAGSDGFEIKALKKIKLLNRLEEWTTTDRLSFESEGIDDRDLLHTKQAETLNGKIQYKQQTEVQTDESPSDIINLKEYFENWENTIYLQVIGGFLSFLGGDPEICRLAEEYLQDHSLKYFRGKVNWVLIESIHGNKGASGVNENIHEAMKKQRIRCQFHHDTNQKQICNLFGERFFARISEKYDTIFIGDFEHCNWPGYRCYRITLRKFDPSNHTKEELVELLYESARILIKKVYCREPNNLSKLWDDLSDSGQLILEIVQHQILENIFLYFKQLGVGHLPKLRKIIKQWNKLRRQLVEIEHADSDGQEIDDTSIKKEIKRIREKLRNAIETNLEIQSESLKAVQRKMEEEFQYTQTSILFELFQNSDDAALELSQMVEETASLPFSDQVKVKWDDKNIVWMHWGRQINEFRRGKVTNEIGRDRGYDADLENMLFLSSSDKGSRQEKVTGKYGLGFKSVFLLADKPKVVSGQLGFEVVGGFFPKDLKQDERKRLQDELNEYYTRGNAGTLFELDTGGDNLNAIPTIIEPFRRLIPLLLIFSHKIKNCELREHQRNSKTIEWHEKPVSGCQHVFTGKVQLSIENEQFSNVIVLRGQKSRALLMSMGATRMQKLPDDIPSFWVTAPTHEKLKVGFAVNGPFVLDIGRMQLAGDAHKNAQLAQQLGDDFGLALSEMFKASLNDWPQFCNALGMVEQNTSYYQFWESVWNIFGKDLVHKTADHRVPSKLIKILLWEKSCGMAKLLETQEVMPTGLPGKYQCLTHQSEVQYNARGIIDFNHEVFDEISKWDVFLQRVKPGEIVSYSSVGSIMRKLFPTDWKREPLELKRIMEWHFDYEDNVSSETANRFGKIVTRNFLDELEKGTSEIRKEAEELKIYLKNLSFKAKNGTPHVAKDLLVIDKDDDDETMRAQFAPDDRVLSMDYQNDAISFFKACRPQMEAQSKILAQWIRDARDEEKRIHAIQYLLHGELSKNVGNILKNKELPYWIKTMSAFLSELKGDEELQLLGTLGYSIEEYLNPESINMPSPYIEKSPAVILNRIFDWWKNNAKSETRKYEKRLYVGGKFPKIKKDELENFNDRVEWLKLFFYGVLQKVGRSKLETNRNFIKLCIDQEWIAPLAQEDPKLHEWIKKWEKYIDEQIQDIRFFHWMKQLIGMFIISRWLDEYVEAFLAINGIPDPFSLNQIIASRESELFQGGGPDAPPIPKILGIGALFIMRELVRKGIVKNENAHRHCYVPVKGVRKLIERLGGPSLESLSREDQSINIYEFIVENLGHEKADFLKSFDIPLQLVAGNDALWDRFFHESRPVEDEGELQ